SPVGDYCSGQQDIAVRVVNDGLNDITNVEVHWTLNGVPQTPHTITATIPDVYNTNNFYDLILTNTVVSYGTPTQLKVWTHLPNGVVDTVNDNDTLLVAISPPRQGIEFPPLPDTVICEG